MPLCACQCGDDTDGVQEFCPGHQTRYASRLRALAVAGDSPSFQELYRRGWVLDTSMLRMAFGFEAEFYGMSAAKAVSLVSEAGYPVEDDGYHHRVKPLWRVTHDSSVQGEGNELVSPVLMMDGTAFKDTRRVVSILRKNGGKVNATCGLHVHHNARDLEIMDVAQALGTWALFQSTINTILPITRMEGSYAMPIGNPRHQMDNLTQFCAGDKSNLARIGERLGSRFRALNLASLQRHGTIEFRQHSGTLNGSKIVNWVKFTKLFMTLQSRGKDCLTLLRQYDNDIEAVNEHLGLKGMIDWLGGDEGMLDFYIKRADFIKRNADTEDKHSNTSFKNGSRPYYEREYEEGDLHPNRPGFRWCGVHSGWCPSDAVPYTPPGTTDTTSWTVGGGAVVEDDPEGLNLPDNLVEDEDEYEEPDDEIY